MNIAGGISAALFHRERTGEAAEIDVSLLSTAWWAAGLIQDFFTPFGDGRYAFVATAWESSFGSCAEMINRSGSCRS
jgi:hypothetical protein